jgi:hypothetical protein
MWTDPSQRGNLAVQSGPGREYNRATFSLLCLWTPAARLEENGDVVLAQAPEAFRSDGDRFVREKGMQ